MDVFIDTIFWPAILAVFTYIGKSMADVFIQRNQVAQARLDEKRDVMRKFMVYSERLLNHHHQASDEEKVADILSVKAQLNELYLRARPETLKKMVEFFKKLVAYSNWLDDTRNGVDTPNEQRKLQLETEVNEALLNAVNAARVEFGAHEVIDGKDELLEMLYITKSSGKNTAAAS
ncbi:MAG: hypothetical protein ABJL99_16185 [Aliishimia sp.]